MTGVQTCALPILTLYLSTALHDWQVINPLRFTALYMAVPVVGLYFSLRLRFVLLAWIATLLVVFALPQLLWWQARWCVDLFGLFPLPPFVVPPSNRNGIAQLFPGLHNLLANLLRHPEIVTVTVQLLIAGSLLWRLRVNLVRRTFSLR